MLKDPNYPEQQEKWRKAAKIRNVNNSCSQPTKQPNPPTQLFNHNNIPNPKSIGCPPHIIPLKKIENLSPNKIADG
jgi:hypothetical protein